MNILRKQKTQTGSVLLVAMTICFVLSIGLIGYFTIVKSNYFLNARSQTWNESLTAAEAGVEDALQLANVDNMYFNNVTNWPSVVPVSGWQSLGNNVYSSQRSLGNGSFWEVYITNSSPTNVSIKSIGNTPWYYGSTSTTNYVQRTVLVTATLTPFWQMAMVALQQIDLKGNNISTDSFDSSTTNYSNNGMYPFGQPNKIKDNGDIATDGNLTNSINIGNADIKGVVRTGPSGTVSIGPQGTVGDNAWVDGGKTGIEAGHLFNDMNMIFQDASLPTDATWVASPNTSVKIGGVTYDHVIYTSGDYLISSFNNVYVSSNINARIQFTTSVNVKGQIFVAGGATLKAYVNAPSFSVDGVINQNGYASAFSYFGLPINTSLSFTGNGGFTGSIYAPEADFDLGGGGNNTIDFIGACVAKTIKMNGHFNFHFDEALKNYGWLGYTAILWREQ